MLVRVPESARRRAAAGAGRPDRGGRASRSRNRNGAGARAARRPPCRSADAIRQWANLGALVDGLHRGDFALIARSLEDTIAEPRRASLVPGLAAIKQRGGRRRRARLQPVGIGSVAVRAVPRRVDRRARRGGDDRGGRSSTSAASRRPTCRRSPAAARACVVRHALRHDHAAPRRRPCRSPPRCSTGWRRTAACTCPETIEPWPPDELARLPRRTLTEIGAARAAPVHPRRARRGDARGGRRRGAEFSDSAGRGRARHLRARAVSRADARVQGRRRARDGAADGVAPRRRAADRAGRHVRRHRQRRRARLPRRARTRASSSSIPTAASARRRKRS